MYSYCNLVFDFMPYLQLLRFNIERKNSNNAQAVLVRNIMKTNSR